MKEEIEKIAKEFFEKLMVEIEFINVENQKENIFKVAIKTPESSTLIGPRGRNLDSIKSLLGLIASKRLDQRIILHLEINDYMKAKEEKMYRYIESKIEIVKKEGKDFRLPFFSSYERKKIHSFISELSGEIYTKSLGEGRERRLYICKKNARVTIDIDGDDI